MFKAVDTRQNFPELEKEILSFWKQNDSFRKSIEIRSNAEEFTFYDGPPFATGLPHYGHILAGTIKDVIPRYKTMQGYKVERKFGWDCHGLPVENLIEKELGLEDKQALLDYGIGNFNEKCRDSVLRFASEWEETVERMGRWVDFKNDYKTMDPEFMESIWWVFKQLWDKDLVYQGLKPMHVCPRCVTPLSNFEVNQGYKDLTDLSVTAKFKVKGEENTYFLAWTTTPWTLPGNMLLAVNPEVGYSRVKLKSNTEDGKVLIESEISVPQVEPQSITNRIASEDYIVATDLIEEFFNEGEYEVLKEYKGSDLAGMEYEPLFDYYKDQAPFKVVTADFVTTDSGTGIVHIAPAFGEDDLLLGKEHDLQAIQHLAMDGLYETGLFESIHSKDESFKYIPVKESGQNKNRHFDEQMVAFLEKEGKVFDKKMMAHSYPTCWRCETPLLNYATKSWFVRVEQIKEQLLSNNQKIHWVPEHLKDGRFGKWLENAVDWAVSRNRYWGTPLPVWENTVSGKHVCVGSVEELKELSGVEVDDLHKHFVDEITFTVDGEEGEYKRIEEVFDCWFESGSMPYAQRHFPFEETIVFKNDFFVTRHGEAEHNVANIASVSLETSKLHPLTESGIMTVANNAQICEHKFDYIITSPFLRTTQTAELFQKYCGGEIIEDERLKEHHLGPELDNKHMSEWVKWRDANDPQNKGPEGGESWNEVQARVADILHEYNEKYEGKRILFVSHGCPVELMINHVKGIESRDKDRGVRIPKGQIIPLQNIKFPADFIAEGLDQTRGWFYTLHVLGTALFDKPAFSNIIVNGIVLAEDGEKMSKSKKNYPDPAIIFNEYGADAMRFYLMNSPVAHANDLRFSERGVSEVVKNVLLPLWNSYSFFVTYANADGWTPNSQELGSISNPLDQWLVSELEILKRDVTEAMNGYQLNKAADKFPKFFDNLTNWYIRRSRRRFWAKAGEGDDADKNAAYSTLYYVLIETCKLLAPFCPFITESMYQNLVGGESIHHQDWSSLYPERINQNLSDEIALTQEVISLGLQLRKNLGIKVRQPLSMVEVAMSVAVDLSAQLETIKEELNVKALTFISNPEELAELQVRPKAKLLGPKFGKKVQEIIQAAKAGNFEKNDQGYLVAGEQLTEEEIEVLYVGKEGKDVASSGLVVVSFDTEISEELKQEGQARDLVRMIQEMRKEADYNVSDRITIQLEGADDVKASFGDYILEETLGSWGDVPSPDRVKEDDGIKVLISKV